MESFNSDKGDLPADVRDKENKALQENTAIHGRKKHVWRVSMFFIYTLPLAILTVVGYICYYLVVLIQQISKLPIITTSTTKHTMDIHPTFIGPLNQFISLWHIFLIIFVVLTTLLGIFVRINMSTWKDENKSKNKGTDFESEFEMIPSFSIVKKATDIFK